MSTKRRKGLLGGIALAGALVLAAMAQAQSSAYDQVYRDFRADGRVTPCFWPISTLEEALRQTPRDTDQYNPDFRQQVTSERNRMRSGSCGTSGAPARLRIVSVRANPAGAAQRGLAASLRQEWVTIRNAGRVTVRLRGWSVANSRNRFYTFPGGSIRSGRIVRVRSGLGRRRGSTFYWRSRTEIWRNRGDQAKLFAPGRRLVQRYRYGSFR